MQAMPGLAASCNTDSRPTIPRPVEHRPEIEQAVALAASPLAGASFRMISTRAHALHARTRGNTWIFSPLLCQLSYPAL